MTIKTGRSYYPFQESRMWEVVYPFCKDLLPSSKSFIAYKENIIVEDAPYFCPKKIRRNCGLIDCKIQ